MAAKASARLFVAVDVAEAARAAELAAQLALEGVGLKLGLEFFCACGPDGVRAVQAAAPGVPLFLDLKFHDIPNTVAGAVRSVAPLAPSVLTIHASGGQGMMRAAVEAATEAAATCGVTRPKILAVTILTSMDDSDLEAVGMSTPAEQQVVRLAQLAKASGVDGVVCSAKEIEPIRAALGADFILMVPGIRPAGGEAGDQKRVVTPKKAIDAGASCIVVGRPITQSENPLLAAQAILGEIGLTGGTATS